MVNWARYRIEQDQDTFKIMCGYKPYVGSVAQIIAGKKFPVGMKFVITGFYTKKIGFDTKCYLEFYDEGFKKVCVDGENVEIVAYDREDKPEEYSNVHEVEIYI